MIFKNKIFSSFSTSDIQKTKAFYTEILQLNVTEDAMGFLQLNFGNGAPVVIYHKENHVPATHTVLNFPVKNIEETVTYLNQKGVEMEQYTGAIATDEKGILRANGDGPDIAWFKDPSGNILSILEL